MDPNVATGVNLMKVCDLIFLHGGGEKLSDRRCSMLTIFSVFMGRNFFLLAHLASH